MHTGLTDRYGARTARVFWLESEYDERATPKSAGLWWHGTAKVWWTFKAEVAAKLVGIATFSDPAVEAELKALHADREETLAASHAASADIEIPRPEGLDYMPFQKAGIAFAMRRNRVLIADEMGLGKAQPLDAKVLTPTGWKQMGDVGVGDLVIGADGKPTRVIGVFPQGELNCYRVTFSDGSQTECSDEHLWEVCTAMDRWAGGFPSVRTLGEIRERLHEQSGNSVHFIPLIKPVEFAGCGNRPIHPYVLGALIGDGGLSTPQVRFASVDTAIVDRISGLLPEGLQIKRVPKMRCDYNITQGHLSGHPNVISRAIQALGLRCRSEKKFVPDVYKLAPSGDRLEMLRGLMDTDGTVGAAGVTQFDSSSSRLADDVAFLVRSLGGTVRRSERATAYTNRDGEKVAGQRGYRLTIAMPNALCPFWLPRKANLFSREKYPPTRAFRSVELVGRKPMQCIKVDAQDQLYVTDDFIVTHNTIQALGLINATPEIQKILVICPASVKINWRREAEKWLVRLTRIALGDGKVCDTKADMLIINFDVAHRWEKELRAITWDLMIIDECHRLKSRDARRTKFILGYTPRTKKGEDESKRVDPIPAKRALLLTGTPIVNRPIEAWNIVHYLDSVNWRSFWGYAKRYAGAFESKWGWQMGGATHLDELQEKLRSTIMVRRLKSEVLAELPPKRRQIITLPADQFAGLIDNEQETMARFADQAEAIETERDLADALDDRPAYDAAVLKLRDMRRVEFTEMARLAHETALAKVPHVVEHVQELLDSVGKVVVFAHHADVISQLMEGFAEYNPVKLTGEMSITQRQQSIDAFQKGAARVFVGSIQAAGVGITLTAASNVVFAELDWVPGNMQQAEDRLHRIGQHDSVNVQHIVVDRSIDARRAKTLLEKQAIIDKALDDPIAKEMIVIEPERKRPADPTLTPERVKAAQQALRFLALMDQDYALDQNGIGFNGGDTGFGHRLAELAVLTPRQALAGIRMVKKYHRQLAGRFGPEILVTLYGADDELVKEHLA